jgi:hypothetical protein
VLPTAISTHSRHSVTEKPTILLSVFGWRGEATTRRTPRFSSSGVLQGQAMSVVRGLRQMGTKRQLKGAKKKGLKTIWG